MGSGEVTCRATESARTPKEKLGGIKCESGNVEVLCDNIQKCMLDSVSDLVGKVDRRARKPWVTQEDE